MITLYAQLFEFLGPVYFSRPKLAAPAAVLQEDPAIKERQRMDAERAAIAERKGAGRSSTRVAGAQIAADEQQGKGLLAAERRKRMASGEMLG